MICLAGGASSSAPCRASHETWDKGRMSLPVRLKHELKAVALGTLWFVSESAETIPVRHDVELIQGLVRQQASARVTGIIAASVSKS